MTSAGQVLLSLCAAIMLVLAAVFQVRSAAHVASGLTRGYIAALCLAGALPYLWILLLAVMRRRAAAAAAGITCALLYLVGFGWFAVLLFLLSWGDTTLWIPAMGLPVQCVALLAAVLARRGVRRAERPPGSWRAAVAMPLALVAIPLLAAWFLRREIVELPQRRQAQAANAATALRAAQRCLMDVAAHDASGYPERLEAAGERVPGCRAALDGLAKSRSTLRWSYLPGPPQAHGVRRAFALCGVPARVPDAGSLSVVADQTGAQGAELAPDGARVPVPCAQAWGVSVPGAVKALQYCLLEHAAAHGGFPESLMPWATQSDCARELVRPATDASGQSALRVGVGAEIGLRYLPEPNAGDGRRSDYDLVLQCPGREDPLAVNVRSEVHAADEEQVADWLNGCRASAPGSAAELARRYGFVVLPAAADGGRPDAAIAAGPVAADARGAAERDPEFGATPDLAARRAECQKSPRDCYGLGREIERSLTLAEANPFRVETLSAAQRALVEEANRAFIRACSGGSRLGCYAAADVLLRGRGPPDDPTGAAALLQRNCAAGHAPSCVRLGELKENGRQPTRSVTSSVALTPGGTARPIMMSVPDRSRPAVAADTGAAIAAFRAACRLGDTGACLRHGRLTLTWPAASESERTAARQRMRGLCESGQAFACHLLAIEASGNSLVEGRPVGEWRRRACALGDAELCETAVR